MFEVFATSDYLAHGIFGMLLGLGVLRFFRPIADFFAARERERAETYERYTPRRIREIASIWYRVGTGDDAGSKAYRYGLVLLLGLVAFLTGLAATLGAWDGS